MQIEEHIPLLESILDTWKTALGNQYQPYKVIAQLGVVDKQ